MTECIAEDDLLDLARGARALGDTPRLESHLADCPACSGLLCTLIASSDDHDGQRDLVGRALGPYRLDARIGSGAMGEVYGGFDLRLQRPVAVKVLAPRFAESPERVAGLELEGRAAARISHVNVVTVHDVGSADGVAFIVSELIAGESLRSLIDRGRLPYARALELSVQLARGLAAAHARGVVHRDLKPSNLIVTHDGVLKIVDFGLAQLGPRDDPAGEPRAVVGTAGYMSPEQARGETADARSDLFAAGAILHELFAGAPAFEGATFAERMSAVLNAEPPPLGPGPGAIITRCLHKDPEHRFQSAHDLAWALEALRGEPDPLARAAPHSGADRRVSRRALLVTAATTGVAGVLGGRALTRSPPPWVPEFQQLTFGQGRVSRARYTRDAGSLLYAASWDTEPMTVFTARVGGGGTRALELPPAQLLAVSSHGQLALSLDHRYIDGFHERGQLALAPLEGGTPQALGLAVQDADFAPHDDGLAIVRRVDARFRLEHPIGTVLLEQGWISHPRFSPDGRLIACLAHDTPEDDYGDLVVIDRDGGAPRTVAAGFSSIDGLAWSADGRTLWVSASVTGGNNAVRAFALDGRALARVPSAGRLRMHDVAPDGALAVTHVTGRLRLMVRAPGDTEDRDRGLSDVSLLADMSADGRSVVFAEFGDARTASGAYLRGADGGPAVRLGEGIPTDLADDGRGVLAVPYDRQSALVIFPVPPGQVTRLAFAGLAGVRRARWCARGGMVVEAARGGGRPRLFRRDPDGSVHPITEEGAFGPFAVSPDGERLALICGDRLRVVAIDGRTTQVSGVFEDERVAGWCGDELLLRSVSPSIRVRRFDPRSGASSDVLQVEPPALGRRGVAAFALSADGAAYAYSYAEELSRLFTMTESAPAAV